MLEVSQVPCKQNDNLVLIKIVHVNVLSSKLPVSDIFKMLPVFTKTNQIVSLCIRDPTITDAYTVCQPSAREDNSAVRRNGISRVRQKGNSSVNE